MSFWKWLFGLGGSDATGGAGGDEPKKKKKKKKKKPTVPVEPAAAAKPAAAATPAATTKPSIAPGAPDDETMAWVDKRLRGLEPPKDAKAPTVQEADQALWRIFEAKRALHGEPHATMLWGLAVSKEIAPRLWAHAVPRIDRLASDWEALLVVRFGDAGRSFVGEMLDRNGLPAGGRTIRRGKRYLTFASPPSASDAADEHESLLVEAEANGLLTMQDGGTRARISTSPEGDDADPGAALEALLMGTRAATLKELTIGLWGEAGAHEYDEVFDLIAANASRLTALETLFVGDFDYPGETEISWTTIGNAGRALATLPGLRSLKLRGGGIELGKLDHPKLESLVVETGGLPRAAVEAIAAACLPALRKLEVWFGHEGYGAEGDITLFGPFFAGVATPNVVDLGLKNAEFSDALAAALVASPLAARIEKLDLGEGTLSDAGANTLADAAGRLGALKHFALDHAYLSDAGAKRLEKAFGTRLQLGELCTPDEYDGEKHYYVAVGE
jgi:hypothetical protein